MAIYTYPSLKDRLDSDRLVLTIPLPADVSDGAQAQRVWCSRLVGAMLWFASQGGGTFVWRGQRDASWPLQPRLNRHVAVQLGGTTLEAVGEEEARILERVRHQHWDRHTGERLGFLELLAVLQHQGVPTRLLDVTRDPLVAAFFASAYGTNPEEERPGAVVAIRVPKGTSVADKPETGQAMSLAGAVQFTPSAAPYALYEPPGLDPRILTQRGLFIVPNVAVGTAAPPGYVPIDQIGIGIPLPKGSYTGASIESFFRNFLRKATQGRPPEKPVNIAMILIPADRKRVLRDYLARAGLTDETMFPDVAGYASSFPPS